MGRYCDDRKKRIFVRKGLANDELKASLLHEMVHAKVGVKPSHGSKFVKELKRIRALGSHLSDSEMDVKEPESIRLTKMLMEETISDLLSDGIPTERVPFLLERELVLSLSEIRAKFCVGLSVS